MVMWRVPRRIQIVQEVTAATIMRNDKGLNHGCVAGMGPSQKKKKKSEPRDGRSKKVMGSLQVHLIP